MTGLKPIKLVAHRSRHERALDDTSKILAKPLVHAKTAPLHFSRDIALFFVVDVSRTGCSLLVSWRSGHPIDQLLETQRRWSKGIHLSVLAAGVVCALLSLADGGRQLRRRMASAAQGFADHASDVDPSL